MSWLRRISKGVAHGLALAANLAVAVQPVFAQQISPANTSAGPTVLDAANGVPLVMIQPPNAAGVSHNQFNKFNVGPEGAVLNNLNANYGMTNLAGYIQGNSNVAGNPASVILNEVTGANRSTLAGYLEVGGTQADVIVANPYGITCDGCGFINTDRAVLTTGRPSFDGPRLTGVSVTQGLLEIGQGGADARGVSQFDLIARKIRFAGSVHGERVRVIAGRNDVIFATGEVRPKAPNGSASPDLAIDSTVFGGMYANKITIVSTERGSGVRAPQTMSAGAGGMHITADGRLALGRAQSGAGASVRSRSDRVVVQRQVVTREALSIEAKRALILDADAVVVSNASAKLSGGIIIQQAGSTVLSGATLSMLSTGGLALAKGARALSYQNVEASAGAATLSQDALIQAGADGRAGQDLRFTVTGPALIAGARLFATGSMQFDAEDLRISTSTDLPQSAFVAGEAMSLSATDMVVRNAVIQTRDALSVKARNSLTTGLGTTFKSGGLLSISAPEARLAATLIESGSDIALSAPRQLNVSDTSIDALGAARISGGDVVLQGLIEGTLKVSLTASGSLAAAGELRSEGAVRLSSGAALLAAGRLAGQDVALTAGGTMQVAGAVLAQNDVSLTAAGALDSQAALTAGGKVQASGASLSQIGDVAANGTVSLTALGGVLNAQGALSAGGDLTLNAPGDLSSDGMLLAAGDVALLSGADLTNSAALASDQTITLQAAGLLTNSGSGAVSDGASALQVSLQGAQIENSGSFAALETVSLTTLSGALSNSGDLTAGQNLSLISAAALSSNGDLVSHGDLELSAGGSITLSGSLQSAGDLVLSAPSLANGADLLSEGMIKLTGQTALTNTGDLTALEAITLTSGGSLLNEGALQSDGTLQLTSQTALTNTGDLSAMGAATLTSGGSLQNDGAVLSTQSVQFESQSALTNTGDLRAQGELTLTSGAALRNEGGLQSGGAITLHAAGLLTNTGSGLATDGASALSLTMEGAEIRNSGSFQIGEAILLSAGPGGLTSSGQLISQTAGVSLVSDGALTASGSLLADQPITATGQDLNLSAAIQSNDLVTLTASGDLRSSGAVRALQGITMTAAGALNQGGDLRSGTSIMLEAGGALTNAGGLFAAQQINMSAGGALTNSGSGLELNHADAQQITLTGASVTQSGTLIAQNDLTLEATSGALLNSGNLGAGGALIALATGDVTQSGTLTANGDLTVNGQNITSTGDLITYGALGIDARGNLTISGDALAKGALTASAGGALTVANTGLLLAEGGALALDAGRFNLAGQITGLADLRATASGAGTISGQINSNGNASVTAASLTVAGAVQALGTITARATAGPATVSGRLHGMEMVSLTSSGATTIQSGAALLSSTGSVAVTSGGSLTSQSGSRIAGQNVALTGASLALAGLAETPGQLTVTSQSGGAANSGTLRATALRVTSAAGVTNTGMMQGNIALQAAAGLSNSGNMLGGTITSVSQSLTNSGTIKGSALSVTTRASAANDGRIESTGDLLLKVGGSFTNRGRVDAERLAELRLAALTNAASGKIEAQTLRVFGTGTITNQGTMLGLKDLGLSTTGGLVNSGQIEGRDRLVVSAASLRNSGALTGRNLLASLAISGAFDNSGGKIHSNGLVDLGLPAYQSFSQSSWGAIGGETISLHGAGTSALSSFTVGAGQSLVSDGNLQIQANTLTNAGTIASASGQLLIKASAALSNTGLLYAADTLVLRSNGAVRNDGGAMLSSGSIVICGASSADCTASFGGDRAGKLINSNGGRIETFGGDILIAAGEIRNETNVDIARNQSNVAYTEDAVFNVLCTLSDGPHYKVCGYNFSTTVPYETDVLFYGSKQRCGVDGCDTEDALIKLVGASAAINESTLTYLGPTATIVSAGSILMSGGDLENSYGLISAADDIHLNLESAFNRGEALVSSSSLLLDFETRYGPTLYAADIDGWPDTGVDFIDFKAETYSFFRDNDDSPSGGDNTYHRRATIVSVAVNGTTYDIAPKIDGEYSKTPAVFANVKRVTPERGRFTLDLNLSQSSSTTYAFGTIEAGGAITGTITGTLTNGAVADHLATRTATPGISPTLAVAASATSTLGASTVVAASGPSINGIGTITRRNAALGSAQAPSSADPLSGVTLGSGLGSMATLSAALFGQGTPLTPGALVIPPAAPISAPGIDGYDLTSPRFAGVVGVPDLAVFSNAQLFKINPNPNSSYLIETRAEFIDQDRFISSDYFLDTLNLDPDLVQKRLGDSLTETYLIRDQIFDLTGQRLIYDGLDEQAQIRAMYDNAIDTSRQLGLRPGVALSPSQVARLTEDIIWLEEREVAGQKVLVPQVYLAKSGSASVSFNGSKITASDIALNVGTLINQSGTIEASNSLSITAQNDILNQSGTISAGGALTLTSAGGTLENLSGKIAGADVVINAVDIISKSETERIFHDHGFADHVLGHASINASGSLSLAAMNDLVISGGKLNAGKDLTIVAGGDVTFGALELGSFETYGSGSNSKTFKHQSVLSSQLNAGSGDINIVAGLGALPGNAIFEATKLTAGQSINVGASGSILLGSAQQIDYSDVYSKSGGWLSKKITRDETLDLVNIVTEMNAGEDVSVTAGFNLLSEAANLSGTSGDLHLQAQYGTLQIKALTDIHAARSYSKKSFLGGLLSFTKKTDSLLADALGAQASFGDDIDLIAGGDLHITGASFTAGGAIATDVGGTTFLNAAVDTSYSFSESHTNNGFVVKDVTDVSIQQDAVFSSFEAGDGVSFDASSPVVIGLDPVQAAIGPAAQQIIGGDVTDPGETLALLPYVLPDANGPPAANDPIVALLNDGADSADPAAENGETNPAFDFSDSQQAVALPGAQDGPGFAIYDELAARDSTSVQELELLAHSYHDEQTSLGVLGQLLVSYLTGQVLGPLSTGASLSQQIQHAVLKTVLSTGFEGVLTGELDLDALLKDVVFSGASAGLSNLTGLGGALGASEQAVLGLDELSPYALLNQLSNSALNAGLQSAIYGGDIADYFAANLRSGVINSVMAGVQEEIGDLVDDGAFTEGSAQHVLLHALTGCAASELLGGTCGAGALSAGATALYAGSLDGDTDWQTQQTALLVSGLAAALASGGDVSVASIATGIGTSAFLNNYLWHAQSDKLEDARFRLRECREDQKCSSSLLAFYEERVAYFEELDVLTTQRLESACSLNQSSPECLSLVRDALCAAEAMALSSCGGVPGFGGLGWGYRMPTTIDNAARFEAGRTYSDRFEIDYANLQNLAALETLLQRYPEAVERVYQRNSVGVALEIITGIVGAGGGLLITKGKPNPPLKDQSHQGADGDVGTLFSSPEGATNTAGGVNLADGFSSFNAFKLQYGPAGPGQAWHHLVEQTPNAGKFAAEAIHNPANLIKLPHGPGTIHNQISGFYSSKQPFTGGQTVRNWLSTKSYQEQFDFGVQTIKDFGGSQYLPPHLR